jgi:hypothetical protein
LDFLNNYLQLEYDGVCHGMTMTVSSYELSNTGTAAETIYATFLGLMCSAVFGAPAPNVTHVVSVLDNAFAQHTAEYVHLLSANGNRYPFVADLLSVQVQVGDKAPTYVDDPDNDRDNSAGNGE